MSRTLLFSVLLSCILGSQAKAMDPNLAQFLYSKQLQVERFSDSVTDKMPHVIWGFYDAAGRGDWGMATNFFNQINAASARYNEATNDSALTPLLATPVWPPLCESYGAYEQFHEWNNRWLHRFGSEIMQSIPPGSIYFGGTDPGRFIISALSESQVEGKPFYTLTQNQLADGTYLAYLRTMYGRKIYIPSTDDSRQAFEAYTADVARRQGMGKLRPGEDVQVVNGQVKVTGQVAVMNINGLLARKIVDENPGHDYYVEESFPLDWMYPQLTPHGLIFKLNTKPVPEITEADLTKDTQYWQKLTDEALGNWLDKKTTVQDVCDFAIKYGRGNDLENYTGDKDFAANEMARKCFSKLRTSIGGLYAWRAQHATDPDETKRMRAAADFAFRQGYAICPYSPEAVYRYVNLLLDSHRIDDAVLIVKTSLRVKPDDQLRDVLSQLEKYR